MSDATIRGLCDAGLWVAGIVVVATLSKFGIIRDPGFSLAGAAFWFAIRARSKSDVNTAHKISEAH